MWIFQSLELPQIGIHASVFWTSVASQMHFPETCCIVSAHFVADTGDSVHSPGIVLPV